MLVSVNKITVTGCSNEEYERVYRDASDLMAAQPGHLRQRLVRSQSEPNVYFAIADWERLEDYRRLATVEELVRIFAQVKAPNHPTGSAAEQAAGPVVESAATDKIKVEHHDCVVVNEH